MSDQQKSSKAIHISLWAAQILLAALLMMGAIMKFMPIEKISVMMPWTGQLPPAVVRLLGVIDLLGAAGLVLPAAMRTKLNLAPWAAVCVIALMICAIIFHVSRGEASVIGVNIFAMAIAIFIAWGRFTKAPVSSKAV